MLLIPDGDQIEGARGYDPSIPQRACLHCAPRLRPLQENLVARYAKANAETALHEAKPRLHVPFSPSLQKECMNAADIIGNFFRNDSGGIYLGAPNASDSAVSCAECYIQHSSDSLSAYIQVPRLKCEATLAIYVAS